MRTIVALVFLLALSGPALSQDAITESVSKNLPQALQSYRWFHAHPELSRKEEKTSAKLAESLEKMGLEVHRNIGGYGLVAFLESGKKGPIVLYRADMDALPIKELTGAEYASQNEGVMHACGHDLHMACALLTLKTLAEHKDKWSGTIMFIGQPAEEVGSGAEAIIADPRFQKLLELRGKPKVALAFHDDSNLVAGEFGLKPGFITANVDSVDILVRGKGGHGAAPNEAIDPIVIASDIVMTLQTIVSRRLAPGTKAVVTVGYFHAGTKRNIIPDSAELKLTVRSYEPENRQKVLQEIERVATQVAASYNAPPPKLKHHAKSYTPAGYNDDAWTARVEKVMKKSLAPERIVFVPEGLVGEDFSEYSRRLKLPSVMLLLGAGFSDKETAGLHSAKFLPDAENALKSGAELMTRIVIDAARNE